MATDQELAFRRVAEDLFLEKGVIPKYGAVRKPLEDQMCEATFSKYYKLWRSEKEALLKKAQNGVIEGEVTVPSTISDAFNRAWAAEVQALRAESATQLAAAKMAMTQDIRDLLQKVSDCEETTELLAEQLDEARQMLSDAKHDAQHAQEKISELQLENGVLSSRVVDLEKQTGETKASLLRGNEELKNAIGKLGAMEVKLASALADNEKVTTARGLEQTQNKNLQAEVLALTQQVASAEDEITGLNTALEQEKAQKENLQAKVLALTEQVAITEGEISGLKGELASGKPAGRTTSGSTKSAKSEHGQDVP